MAEADHERWLTYVELGELLGCTPTAARMHAKRRGWARRSPNMIGDRARVLVPDEAAVRPRATDDQRVFVAQIDEGVNSGDHGDQANVQAFCAAITALSDALAAERERVIRGEQQIDRLQTDLADAQAAEKRRPEYRLALTRGIHVGRFIRWVEGGNA